MAADREHCGWVSSFDEFCTTSVGTIRSKLQEFLPGSSPQQVRAWTDSIPLLQRAVRELVEEHGFSGRHSVILEYELPMESRRPDAVFLMGSHVVVMECKGKLDASQADVDQVAAYARDLRCYHRECASREVVPLLIPTRAHGDLGRDGDVQIVGSDAVSTALPARLEGPVEPPADRERFLDEDAYCPLPTLVQAARELLESGTVRAIHRARAATEPAVETIEAIVRQAAATRSRHLVLLSGVPGAGKTLVGLQVAHARYLDELAIARKSGKETTPAVFLSGNGPLVEVLQYALKDAGGDGKTFVRGVKEYVRRYSKKPGLVPPEHLLVFDEAQRAFDAAMVAEKHKGDAGAAGKSEPEHFVEFAERIPEWCVVVGLIGSGQEIHVGEEAGIVQWRWAVENAGEPSKWTVHAPPRMSEIFEESTVAFAEQSSLNLDTELRFHATADLHRFVGGVLESPDDPALPMIADRLERNGFHLRVTRCVDTAKEYLRERYAEDPDARFGLLVSSKDRDLIGFGVPNDFQSTKRLRMGPWYGDGEDVPGSRSCRLLDTCQTEFGAQGLELDATLLAWGTDFVVRSGCWSNANARGYQKKALVRDAHQLRLNAYRVLMTRGRDGCVIWVPPLEVLDQTFLCLKNAGCRELDARR
jgi:hypothetical protein